MDAILLSFRFRIDLVDNFTLKIDDNLNYPFKSPIKLQSNINITSHMVPKKMFITYFYPTISNWVFFAKK